MKLVCPECGKSVVDEKGKCGVCGRAAVEPSVPVVNGVRLFGGTETSVPSDLAASREGISRFWQTCLISVSVTVAAVVASLILGGVKMPKAASYIITVLVAGAAAPIAAMPFTIIFAFLTRSIVVMMACQSIWGCVIACAMAFIANWLVNRIGVEPSYMMMGFAFAALCLNEVSRISSAFREFGAANGQKKPLWWRILLGEMANGLGMLGGFVLGTAYSLNPCSVLW